MASGELGHPQTVEAAVGDILAFRTHAVEGTRRIAQLHRSCRHTCNIGRRSSWEEVCTGPEVRGRSKEDKGNDHRANWQTAVDDAAACLGIEELGFA